MFLLATLILFAAHPGREALAQQGQRLSFIRDAEVENNIRTFSTPLFQAAGLDPEAVSIHIISDPTLNAFVAAGQNLFINTGLLIRAENPGQIIGVIAHETGHIAGGHLVRLHDAAGKASSEALLSMLLGAALMIGGGGKSGGDAGAAVMMGGQEVALRSLMAYSRSEESAADQAGIKFLEATGQSAKGMLEFFNILGDQEMLVSSRQDPYVRTHPLTRDRIAFVREQVQKSNYADVPPRPEFVEMQRRIRAKLFAFLNPPVTTLQRYKENDPSIEARYARAMAFYRKPDLTRALPLIDGLIAERPKDPYFHELKGQMLFENGRGTESLEPYRKSVALLPDNTLMKVQLAQALIEQDDDTSLKEARGLLEQVTNKDPTDRTAWRLSVLAHGKLGDEGMAAYAMAEQAVLENRIPDALFHAGKAERLLPKTGSVWLRLQDIKERANQIRELEKKKRGW